jgi:hypothetical protein
VTIERKIHNLRVITSNVSGIKIRDRDCPPVRITFPSISSLETNIQPIRPRVLRTVIDRGGTRRI